MHETSVLCYVINIHAWVAVPMPMGAGFGAGAPVLTRTRTRVVPTPRTRMGTPVPVLLPRCMVGSSVNYLGPGGAWQIYLQSINSLIRI